MKIRGTALHIAEKYVQLARDAQASGDRIGAENYLQHAEHYYRIVAAAQAQMPQPQQIFRADDEGDEEEENFGDRSRQNPQGGEGGSERPAYFNGNGNGNGHSQPTESDAEGNDEGGEENRFDAGEAPGQGAQPFESRSGENRSGENREPRQQREGSFRGRRRRPYRDNFNGDQPARSETQGTLPVADTVDSDG